MPAAPLFPLQVFYDGSCSVCASEMDLYRHKEHGGRLIFVDISDEEFDPAPNGISMNDFMHEMHAVDRQGRIYCGVHAFWAIWHAFPNSAWYRFLSSLIDSPVVNPLARLAYSGFARIRKYFPKNRRACDTGVCNRPQHKRPQ